MKNILCILILILLSCNNEDKQTGIEVAVNATEKATKAQNTNNSKYHTLKDTFTITSHLIEPLNYTKTAFNDMVDKHPEFFQAYPNSPDMSYFMTDEYEGFESQVGQDTYYMVYSHFLKQRNGVNEYAEQRKKLIEIYSNINSFYRYLEFPKNGFVHRAIRIVAYAEYTIYELSQAENDIEKPYDSSKQKDLYIQSFRQLIEDESNTDGWLSREEKVEGNIEQNGIVDQLDSLITDIFYLRSAQSFQYGHYECH